VVMRHDHCGAILADGLFEYLAHPDHRGVERADVDGRDRLHAIFGVE
jgi:hypothetical protein